MRQANYQIVFGECSAERVTVRDIGPHDQCPTITNAPESVIAKLSEHGFLQGKRLFYYDSEDELGEIVYDGLRFVRFAPVERVPQ